MKPNPFRANEIVVSESRGMFQVVLPLDGVTWVNSLVERDGALVSGLVDTFEWTLSLRPAKARSLELVKASV